MIFKVVTHNMGDTGEAVRHGAIIGWTEANYGAVRALSSRSALRSWTKRKGTPGLAFSWDPKTLTVHKIKAFQTHKGRAKVSPNRGFLRVRGVLADGTVTAVFVTHAVNNAFGPVKRSNRALRVAFWWQNQNKLARQARRLEKRGILVLVVGDFNRKEHNFFPPFKDTRVGKGKPYDRIFVSRRVKVLNVRKGPRHGSDHSAEIVKVDTSAYKGNRATMKRWWRRRAK